MSTGWGITIAGALIAAAIYFGAGDPAMVLLTVILAFLTYVNVRSGSRIEWFTGAMERHSDQMRQLTAKEAGVKIIWWDKTLADGLFPFDGEHGKEVNLDIMYVGVPPEHRSKRPNKWRRTILGGR